MTTSTVRRVASALAISVFASTAGAAEPTKPTLWTAAREAGARASVSYQSSPAATTTSRGDSTFFKSTAGKISLGLMAVGLGLTVYSIHHDRGPVKSVVR